MDAPPDQIDLPQVGAMLRRHRIDDLEALHAAIEVSRDHLRPWMAWADQPSQATASFLERSVADWEDGRDFGYIVIDTTDGSALGGTGLHDRLGDSALEIGYWRRVDVPGRGLVTTWTAALTEAAFALAGTDRVEILCDEANRASAAVPQRLGYTLDRIEDRAITAPGQHGRAMVWSCRPGQLQVR